MRTGVSHRLGSSLPEHLAILKHYGPDNLAEDEYRRRLRHLVRSYYRFLGASFFRRPGREFWAYHRGQLAALGLSASRLEDLAGGARRGRGLAPASAAGLRPDASLRAGGR